MIKKLYNPGAFKDNAIVIHESDSGCDNCPPRTVCQYSTAAMETINATAVVIKDDEGNDVTYNFDQAATTRTALREALLEALHEAGYDEDGADGIILSGASNATILEVVGEAVLVSITNAGSPVNFAVTCERAVVCTYELAITDAGEITYEGDSSSLGNLEYGTDSAGDLQTALDTAVGSEVQSVTVTDDEPNSRWIVTIKDFRGKSISIDGASFAEYDCKAEWIPQAV